MRDPAFAAERSCHDVTLWTGGGGGGGGGAESRIRFERSAWGGGGEAGGGVVVTTLELRLPPSMSPQERLALERRARLLAWGRNAWHVVEFGVAIVAGVIA